MQTQFIIYLSLLGLTLLFGLVTLKRLTSPFRFLVLLIGYVFVTELVDRIMVSLSWENSFPVYHFSAIFLILLTVVIYLKVMDFSPVSRRFIIAISIGCGILAILNTLFHQNLDAFPTFSIAAHGFQSIVLALITFNEMIKAPARIPLLKQPLFWMNCGTFIFYSSNFIGFILYNEYYKLEGITFTWIAYLNWIGNMVIYTCYLTALYLNQKGSHE